MIERIETIEVHQRCNDGSWAWETTAGVLVRCENCKSWKKEECDLPSHGWCETLQQLTHSGDFCSWCPNYDEGEEK